jgi:hypothetical protein
LLDDPEAKVQRQAVQALGFRREEARRVLKLRMRSAEARPTDAAAADVFTKILERIDPGVTKDRP